MYGATALLILPADLPLLKPESFQVMLIHADNSQGMAIAPDWQLKACGGYHARAG
jgi:molybdopterin-guanine dinucleotide biosynthesis protein A